jgi:hypothetical protein
MEVMQLIGLIILAAAVGEGVIEFLPVPILDKFIPNIEANRPVRTVILNILSAVLGVGIAVNFGLGLFSLLGAAGHLGAMDEVLTGVLVGRGSNYVHNFVEKFIISQTEKKP